MSDPEMKHWSARLRDSAEAHWLGDQPSNKRLFTSRVHRRKKLLNLRWMQAGKWFRRGVTHPDQWMDYCPDFPHFDNTGNENPPLVWDG